MPIDLSADEMRTLRVALERAVKRMEDELVHTEAPSLQHALNRDYQKLVALRDRLVGEGRATPVEGRISSATI
jgi:hypothetical protein